MEGRAHGCPWEQLAYELAQCLCVPSAHTVHTYLCVWQQPQEYMTRLGAFFSDLVISDTGRAEMRLLPAQQVPLLKRASNRACIWRNKSMLVWGVFALFVKGFRGSLCLMSLSQQPQCGCRIIQRWWITRGQTTDRHVSLYCSGYFILLKIHLNIVAPLLKRDHKALLNLASDWDFSEFSVQYFSSNNSNRQAVTERKIIWITFKCSFLK